MITPILITFLFLLVTSKIISNFYYNLDINILKKEKIRSLEFLFFSVMTLSFLKMSEKNILHYIESKSTYNNEHNYKLIYEFIIQLSSLFLIVLLFSYLLTFSFRLFKQSKTASNISNVVTKLIFISAVTFLLPSVSEKFSEALQIIFK